MWYDNKFVDTIHLGILRREWAAKHWSAEEQEKKRPDPFAPPYVPNLLLGEVRDEFEGHEYVVLVRALSVCSAKDWES